MESGVNFGFLAPEHENKDKLMDFNHGTHWNFEELEPIIGQALTHLASNLAPQLSDAADSPIWIKEPTGVFSSKSVWEAIRKRGISNPVLAHVWRSLMPLKTKLIVWRLMHNILPVDLLVKKTWDSSSIKVYLL